ncbi:MAG: single-stranded-DNA-specific exonuclease RecJ, partial [Myxococcota bacterium]
MSLEIREGDPDAALDLARALGIHPLAARVLVARGFGDEVEARAFLDPKLAALRPPDAMAGMAQAVACLGTAVQGGKTIGLFGDYDVDGVSATAVLASWLRAAGARTVTRVASREAGYGFQLHEAEALIADGAQVVVTLDCGTSDIETIGALRARGIDVVVVDHHQVPQGLSPATALLNPHRADSAFPFRGLCSAGLAFYLCAALRTRIGRGDAATDPRALLDLVALGTIADVAPLVCENRILVAHGLRALSKGGRPGLRALLARAQLSGEIGARDVAFRLAPRLNAPGRLGEARPALECLLAEDEAAGEDRASFCDERNRERQAIQETVTAAAVAQVEGAGGSARAFVLAAGEGWHPGVVGIVAAKLVERFGKPAAVVALDGALGRGSARTIDGVNLHELLATCGHPFVRFGGHAAACGFTVEASAIGALREALERTTLARLGEGRARAATPCDAEASTEDLTLEAATDLTRLAPFGAGNAEPLIAARSLEVVETRTVGKGHLQLRLRAGRAILRGIAFGMAARAPAVGTTI